MTCNQLITLLQIYRQPANLAAIACGTTGEDLMILHRRGLIVEDAPFYPREWILTDKGRAKVEATLAMWSQ